MAWIRNLACRGHVFSDGIQFDLGSLIRVMQFSCRPVDIFLRVFTGFYFGRSFANARSAARVMLNGS